MIADNHSSKAIVKYIVFLTVILAGCSSYPQPSDFEVGMSRDEVTTKFSEPDNQRSLVKTEEHVWGPIEDFWPSVPSGSRIEIWYYTVDGGTVELYFLDGSTEVKGTGFAPEDTNF